MLFVFNSSEFISKNSTQSFLKKLLHYSICSLLFSSSLAIAEDPPTSFKEFIQQSTVDGYLRSYDFSRNFGNSAIPMQKAFSFGGGLNFYTLPVKGFRLGASYYAAESLGLNSSDVHKRDNTLPARSIHVLGQSYIEFQNPIWLLRAGNQIIKTPWLNDIDTRIIPASYQALYVKASPVSTIDVTALRVFKYKSRIFNEFTSLNLYSPKSVDGTPLPNMQGLNFLGSLASGVAYKKNNFQVQAWYYKFYDLANLFYADVNYTVKTNTGINPLVGAQLAKETGDGKNYLNDFGYGKTDALVLGVLTGVEIPNGQFTLGFNSIPTHSNAFKNGDVVSPYTSGYVADPLYTSSMIAGLIEKAAGYGMKLGGSYLFFDKQLNLAASFAKYYNRAPVNNTNEFDFDIIYKISKSIFKGLSLRNRVGILNGNKSTGRFLYNRLMIQYEF
jgi:hypothetical protein